MAATIDIYDHTTLRFANGANASGDTYKINLYSAFTFDATATTKAAAESGATQLTTQFGYTQNDKTVTVTATTVSTDDAKLDLDDVTWTASGGDIGPARYAMVYNDTDANDPPVLYIDFGENKTAGDGTDFKITWDADGVLTFTVT